MKQIFICAMLLTFANSLFSQQTYPKQTFTHQDYLKNSKNQKTAAWVLLGAGTGLIVTGFLVGNRKEASFDEAVTGVVTGILGALSAIGSIPLFIASGRNKRKAMNISTYFEILQNPGSRETVCTYYPSSALTIKMKF